MESLASQMQRFFRGIASPLVGLSMMAEKLRAEEWQRVEKEEEVYHLLSDDLWLIYKLVCYKRGGPT